MKIKQFRKFGKALKKYNKGKSIKGLNIYKITKEGKRIPIVERLELIEG